jgi:hypothetical protein
MYSYNYVLIRSTSVSSYEYTNTTITNELSTSTRIQVVLSIVLSSYSSVLALVSIQAVTESD